MRAGSMLALSTLFAASVALGSESAAPSRATGDASTVADAVAASAPGPAAPEVSGVVTPPSTPAAAVPGRPDATAATPAPAVTPATAVTPAPAAAPPLAVPAAAATGGGSAAADDPIQCRNGPATGTRLPSRVCKPKSAWDKQAKDASANWDERMRRSSNPYAEGATGVASGR